MPKSSIVFSILHTFYVNDCEFYCLSEQRGLKVGQLKRTWRSTDCRTGWIDAGGHKGTHDRAIIASDTAFMAWFNVKTCTINAILSRDTVATDIYLYSLRAVHFIIHTSPQARCGYIAYGLCVCTVTDFSAKDKTSGVEFCTAVHRRPRQGIPHFCELCSPRNPKSSKSTSARATPTGT